MAFDELQLLEQLGGQNPFGESRIALAAAHEAVEDAAEARRAEQRQAEAIQRQETLALLDRQMGGPIAEVRRHQMQAADLADKVRDLEDQLENARGKLDACRASLEWWSERLTLVDEGTRRSTPPTALERTKAAAAEAYRQAAEDEMTRKQVLRAARERQKQGRRKLASRSDSPASYLTAESQPAGHVSFRGGGEIVGVE
jgi:hypothetical protein